MQHVKKRTTCLLPARPQSAVRVHDYCDTATHYVSMIAHILSLNYSDSNFIQMSSSSSSLRPLKQPLSQTCRELKRARQPRQQNLAWRSHGTYTYSFLFPLAFPIQARALHAIIYNVLLLLIHDFQSGRFQSSHSSTASGKLNSKQRLHLSIRYDGDNKKTKSFHSF